MADSVLKRLELAVRRWMTHRPGGAEPIVVSAPTMLLPLGTAPRIVVLRQDRIGDVLVSVPVIRALRERYPAAVIDMVLSPNNLAASTLVRHWVNGIIIYRKSLVGLIGTIRRLRQGRYDVIIDLMDNPSATSTMLVLRSDARFAVGIDKANRTAYTHVVPLPDRSAVHIVERLANLLLPFGIDPAAVSLELDYPLTAEERDRAGLTIRADGRPILGVNISGSDDSRRYPMERWTTVITTFMHRHPTWRVVVLAAPPDAQRQTELAAATGAEVVPVSSSFHAFAALVSWCSLIVSPDTSIVHLAAAFKIPAVIMYVFDDPTLMPWHPYGSAHRSLYSDAAIASIEAAAVNDALDVLSSSNTTMN